MAAALLQNPKIHLPSERTPSTIDKDVICSALEITDETGKAPDEKTKEFLLKTTTTLRLEFRQILKVENLHYLSALTRLFLDNNFIERMSGFDQLIHLEWLDLSFNKIKKIEGLQALKRLEVLSLYSNEVSVLDSLDHLRELKVLRAGENRLEDRANVIYLRRLPSLRTLSIKGNPFCETEDWDTFTIALLPRLLYLECSYIGDARREEAVTRHQGDIFRARNKEDEEKDARDKRDLMLAHEKRQRAAFVASLQGPQLFKSLMGRNEKEEKALRECLENWHDDVLWNQFQSDIQKIGDDIYNLGLTELSLREEEVKLFEECIKGAQKSTQKKGIREIDRFHAEKEVIFDSLFDLAAQIEDKVPDEITDLQREEVEKLREQFSSNTKETWGKVISYEVTLVNQTEQVLHLFEENINSMLERFVAKVKELFASARAVDTRYFRRLTEIGETLEEQPYSLRDADSDSAGRDQISELIAKCHDGHQELLLEEEANLQEVIKKWKEDFLLRFRKKERKRNRNRVLELNHFLDVMRQEEEEFDIIPTQLSIAEDILID